MQETYQETQTLATQKKKAKSENEFDTERFPDYVYSSIQFNFQVLQGIKDKFEEEF